MISRENLLEQQLREKSIEIERLKEDIRVFKFTIKTQQEQIQELIAREDKAIEFLNDECSYDEKFGFCDDLWCGDVQKLVDILKGVEKE